MSKPQDASPAPTSLSDAATTRQFVIFYVDAECFAVSLSEVKEIIRMPEVVRLPLSPSSLDGLANLRGTVLPIVSTRRLFHREDAHGGDATRVVILDHGHPIGIVVDRMASVVTVEEDLIDKPSSASGSIWSSMVQGMIRDLEGFGVVMILDTRRLLAEEYGRRDIARAGGGPSTVASGGSGAERGGAAAARDEVQLVSFEVAGQEYALPIKNVQEIVQLPERITQVPKVADSVLGMMTLRNRLLPVLSLRALFHLEPAPLEEHNRVVVVRTAGDLAVGVVMDRVNEVVRVSRSGVDPVPPLLAADPALREITAICRLNGGERIVSILSAEAMFDGTDLAAVFTESSADENSLTDHLDRPEEDRAVNDEQFVVFRLMDVEYGVGISSVQEIVRVPEEIASIPKTPGYIRGVMNLRGAVIPLIDQRTRFGLPAAERSDRQRIMVFTIQGSRTGFIVDAVSEVMRIPSTKIEDAPEMSEDQRRMVRRVANFPESRRMILLLDAHELLDSQELEQLNQAA